MTGEDIKILFGVFKIFFVEFEIFLGVFKISFFEYSRFFWSNQNISESVKDTFVNVVTTLLMPGLCHFSPTTQVLAIFLHTKRCE